MTHNWQIGDEVIMTVDSRKGEIWSGYKDGEYEATVIPRVFGAIFNVFICIEKTKEKGSFKNDGSNPFYPGMSIRPANYAPGQIPIEKSTTPSQWIEGQIPNEYTGDALVCDESRTQKSLIYCANGLHDTRLSFKIAYHFLIPPPPPLKEVEAYGFLECVSKAKYDDIEYIEKARRFFSRPATAENLEKYLNVKGRETQSWQYDREELLDQFISQFKSEQPETKLLFTPAALEKLGIR